LCRWINVNQIHVLDAFFPLTPALSLREREKRSQLFDETKVESCSNACGFYIVIQRLFLLPQGEGQDEGEGD
jgi:hypothetical protein